VEENRHAQIPDWAYRDVLFMLINYSVTSYEVLYRKLTNTEKEEIFESFYRVGARMGLTGLPNNYAEWTIAHEQHLQNDTVFSDFTVDLYKQYRKHLGYGRYQILKRVQALIVPAKIKQLLSLGNNPFFMPILWGYKLGRSLKLGNMITRLILPKAFRSQVNNLSAE
jgi:hypothetical protein